jgi:AcrR family transcriptional regulator
MGAESRSTKSAVRVRAVKGSKQRAGRRPRVQLETKTLPSQARSRNTFDAILRVAGDVLADKGPDDFSINAVSQRSGLSPPAFYRYFPNKYALLKAMAERLMEAADDAVLLAMSRNDLPRSETDLIAELRRVLSELVTAMASFPGSVPILRALRAKQEMRHIQLASTARVAARRTERLRAIFPTADPDRLRRGARLGLETANIISQLIVEAASAEAGGTAKATIAEAAVMLGRYYWHLGVREVVEDRKKREAPTGRG